MISKLIWWTGMVVWILVVFFLLTYLRRNNGTLHRSHTNRKICGVCGGIGESVGVDPTAIRLIWVVFTLCGGSGILVYLLAAFVMPE